MSPETHKAHRDPQPAPQGGRERRTFAPVPAEHARQGRIVLRTRLQRLIFILGLAGTVGLGVILTIILARS